jgi:hypothetical protein
MKGIRTSSSGVETVSSRGELPPVAVEVFSLVMGARTSATQVLPGEAEECGDEEAADLPVWQEQEWEIAKRIVSTDCFQKLPTKFEAHEWAIMQDFSRSMELDRVREDLLGAIQGAGAFRDFKATL